MGASSASWSGRFDPVEHGWTKMEVPARRCCVMPAALDAAISTGRRRRRAPRVPPSRATASSDTIRSINVDGTLNTFLRRGRMLTVRRFVYASSVAAYGFHSRQPGRVSARSGRRGRRAASSTCGEKAEIEHLLAEASQEHPEVALYVLRPPIGARAPRRGSEACRAGTVRSCRCGAGARRRYVCEYPCRSRCPIFRCSSSTRTTSAGHSCSASSARVPRVRTTSRLGEVTLVDMAREVGLVPLRVPYALVRIASRAVTAIPLPVPQAGWVEVAANRPSSTPVRPSVSSAGNLTTQVSSHSAPTLADLRGPTNR